MLHFRHQTRLCTLLLLTCGVALAVYAQVPGSGTLAARYQQAPGAVTPETLRAFGIDPSDTATAVARARELGIPEDEINRLLEQQRTQAGEPVVAPAPVPAAKTTDTVTAKMEPAPTEPAPVEPVPATGAWQGLTYFGYDIFRAGKGRVAAIEVGPVDPGYVIGAGDVLKLTLWGEVEYQYQLEVGSEGTILVPEAGQIFVAGTRLEDLRETLTNYLSKFYSGLADNPPTVFFDVSISRPHGNQIYIMGEVDHPGAYSISSFATAFNAMYVIGGPLVTGSLRDVRILREGGIASHVDLYDYLVKGISTDDRRLQHNDIVFVPPRGKTVGIKGEVNRPGVYELSDGETVQDLVRYAGRLKPTAYTFRAQIERIRPAGSRTRGEFDREIVDVNLEDPASDWTLADGDLVVVFPISDRLQNFVELIGEGVFRPGRYQLDRIATLSQLIVAADGLTPYAVRDRVEIIRTRDDLTREYLEFDLGAALAGDPSRDPVLRHMDTVRVFSKHDLVDAPMVTLSGHAKRPGRYPLPESLSLYSLLFNYAGLQDSLWRAQTFMARGDIFRLEADGETRSVIPFDVQSVWRQEPGADRALRARDEVVLYAATVADLYERWVFVDGEVKTPGRYEWKRNMTITDLLREAGGFRKGAMYLQAEVARVTVAGIPGDTLARIIRVPIMEGDLWTGNPDSLIPAILQGGTNGSRFRLEPNDHVSIRTNPEFEQPGVVKVTGQVVYPGSYTLKHRNESLSEMIDRCGGLTNSAYAGGGQLFRGGKRLYLDFEKLLNSGRRREDVTLQPGDSIAIPTHPNTVLITGEVMNPGFYKYLPGAGTREYLAMAGGRTDSGDRVLLQQPSGRTFEWGFFQNQRPMDGALIQVYPKPPRKENKPTDWSLVIKDTFAITASAATIIVLVYQMNN